MKLPSCQIIYNIINKMFIRSKKSNIFRVKLPHVEYMGRNVQVIVSNNITIEGMVYGFYGWPGIMILNKQDQSEYILPGSKIEVIE